MAMLFAAPMTILMLTFPNGTIVPPRFRVLIPLSFILTGLVFFMTDQEVYSVSTMRSKIYFGIGLILVAGQLTAQIYR